MSLCKYAIVCVVSMAEVVLTPSLSVAIPCLMAS